jgi:hypothetical protein
VVVNVFGVPNTGDPAQQLAATEADVFIARANNGSFAETALAEPVGGPGPFTTTNVHIGHHGLRVVGGGTYAGAATVRSVTTLRGGTIAANVTLVQP